MNDQRYHLTLSTGDRPAMHGWWGNRQVADRKFTRWVGEYSDVAGARIVLTDEEEQRVLASWPEETDRLPD
ncbi:hypothetical protein ACFVT5_41505 [Streptomyces sp. NPDC058001]|uniref:hypothetical protein n=1 Tax=Streptomyces sp. NPDC058001 TaxID=3346300 RepID=UPI0036ED6456